MKDSVRKFGLFLLKKGISYKDMRLNLGPLDFHSKEP